MLKGIDISHFSDVTADSLMNMIKQNRLYFNFIKASEGESNKDAKFIENWRLSRSVGFVCGAYHFFRPLSNPSLQADNFITQYKLVSRAGVLPPVVDIEWTKSSKSPEQWSNVIPAKRPLIIREYLARLELELNVKPIIYTAANFWKEFLQDHSSADDNRYFGSHTLWLADPNNRGLLPNPWAKADFIQTHFGEQARTTDAYDKLDQDTYSTTLRDFLNITMPGFTLMRGFPFSYIVMDIQEILKNKTGSNGSPFLADAPDGFFGKNTQDAVIEFQKDNGLTGTGIIDAQTWLKLL